MQRHPASIAKYYSSLGVGKQLLMEGKELHIPVINSHRPGE